MDLYFDHPTLSTDSFGIYVKAASLMGKVKTFNLRYRMRYPSPLDSPLGWDDLMSLDNTIQSFITSLPREYCTPFIAETVDPILYTAHLLPQV